MKKTIIILLLLLSTGAMAQNYRTPCDSLNARLIHVNDSLRGKLISQNERIVLVKLYLTKVQKKPSNIKYLKGWITRALQ